MDLGILGRRRRGIYPGLLNLDPTTQPPAGLLAMPGALPPQGVEPQPLAQVEVNRPVPQEVQQMPQSAPLQAPPVVDSRLNSVAPNAAPRTGERPWSAYVDVAEPQPAPGRVDLQPGMTAPQDLRTSPGIGDRIRGAASSVIGSDAVSGIGNVLTLPFNVLRAYGDAYAAIPGQMRAAEANREVQRQREAEFQAYINTLDERQRMLAYANRNAWSQEAAKAYAPRNVGAGDSNIMGEPGTPGFTGFTAPKVGVDGGQFYTQTPGGVTVTGTRAPSYAENTDRMQAAEAGRHNQATEGVASAQVSVSQGELALRQQQLKLDQDRLNWQVERGLIPTTTAEVVAPIMAKIRDGTQLSQTETQVYNDYLRAAAGIPPAPATSATPPPVAPAASAPGPAAAPPPVANGGVGAGGAAPSITPLSAPPQGWRPQRGTNPPLPSRRADGTFVLSNDRATAEAQFDALPIGSVVIDPGNGRPISKDW